MPHADLPDRHPGDQHAGDPARSTGPALFVGGWALSQLWLFWVAPIIGALMYGWVGKSDRD